LFLFLAILLINNSVMVLAECSDNSDCATDEVCVDGECVEDSGAEITVDQGDSDDKKIRDAYNCVREKVEDKCSSLGLQDMIFSLLVNSECKSELLDESDNEECWPDSGCNVKTTAQAILGLSNVGKETEDAEDWLLEQTTAPDELIWYLQIDANEETTCTIEYSGSTKTIQINEDKKITSSAGSCLLLAESGYWLQVNDNQNCLENEYKISCNKGFLTNTLYRKQGSSTIYVPDTTQTASAEGTTTEKINSLCFKKSSSCDYESTLWATLVLDYQDHDIEEYLPYLTAMAEDNEEFLPEAFLYILTDYSDFYSSLLEKQKASKYWDESGDKFYDTGLALLALKNTNPSEKENTLDWLLEDGIQDSDGCWKGNIKNTALILYSTWPEIIEDEEVREDCGDAGYYCVSSSLKCQQAGGERKAGYKCPGFGICCSKPETQETCSSQGGTVCSSDEECYGSKLPDTLDLSLGEACCLGECKPKSITPEESECERYEGNCRASCLSGEETENYECDFSTDICCVKEKNKGTSLFWIIILIILIILVIVAIIFRNKLRPLWVRLKSGFRKSGAPAKKITGPFPPRSGPSQFTQIPQRRIMPRRIIPSTQPRAPIRRPVQKKPSELDDVLKKLKEMGK